MSQMPLIDFDEHFADFTSEWLKNHKDEYRTFDEMEDDMVRIYTEFLNTRAVWLDGITPGAFFTQYEDPKVLVDWLNDYCDEGISVPDLLLEQITFVGRPCEKRLLELLKDNDSGEEAKMTAIGLLREMGSTLPKMLYINWQIEREQQDELKDNAVESLKEMGECVVQPILQIIGKANTAGQEALLDILVRYPMTEQVFDLAIKLFRDNPDRRALLAGYLAKIGDERALPDLIKAAEEKELRYLNYIEIRNAIEELGGDCPERDFEEDPEYDALRALDAE